MTFYLKLTIHELADLMDWLLDNIQGEWQTINSSSTSGTIMTVYEKPSSYWHVHGRETAEGWRKTKYGADNLFGIEIQFDNKDDAMLAKLVWKS